MTKARVAIGMVMLLVILGAGYYLFSRLNQDPHGSIKEVDLPDYSKINVPGVIKSDSKEGSGKEVFERSHVQLSGKVFVYDPSKKGNRGAVIADFSTQARAMNLSRLAFENGFKEGLYGMKEGGSRKIIVPGDRLQNFDAFGSLDPKLIYQFEIDDLSIIDISN